MRVKISRGAESLQNLFPRRETRRQEAATGARQERERIPVSMMLGVNRKRTVVSLNVVKLPMLLVRLLRGRTIAQPINPPNAASRSDSTRKLARISRRENPSTRNVPISLDRLATAEYIVFIALNELPTAIITATNIPTNCTGFAAT